jgi:hypothetical protein
MPGAGLIFYRLVCLFKDVRFARIELSIDAPDDKISWRGFMITFKSGDY